MRESTGTTKETVARRILRLREGDVEKGIPIVPQMGKILFDDAADDLLNDYRINGKASLESVERRVDALKPTFKTRRLISITTSDVRPTLPSDRRQGPRTPPSIASSRH